MASPDVWAQRFPAVIGFNDEVLPGSKDDDLVSANARESTNVVLDHKRHPEGSSLSSPRSTIKEKICHFPSELDFLASLRDDTDFRSKHATVTELDDNVDLRSKHATITEIDDEYDLYLRSKYAKVTETDDEPGPHPVQDQETKASASCEADQSPPHRASQAPRPSPPSKETIEKEKTRPEATKDDARLAGIPAGYLCENWDPAERPIIILSSVFDPNSVGNWIYDWMEYCYGPSTSVSLLADNLRLLVSKLAGYIKRANETIAKIKDEEEKKLVEEFLEDGERLWVRFEKLVRICEGFMFKPGKKDELCKNSGSDFVQTMFGRDRELDTTKKLVSAIRQWTERFEAKCEKIFRKT